MVAMNIPTSSFWVSLIFGSSSILREDSRLRARNPPSARTRSTAFVAYTGAVGNADLMRPLPLVWSRCQCVFTIAAIGRSFALASARMASLCQACLPVSMTTSPCGASKTTVFPSGPRSGSMAPRNNSTPGAIFSGEETATSGAAAAASQTIEATSTATLVAMWQILGGQPRPTKLACDRTCETRARRGPPGSELLCR